MPRPWNRCHLRNLLRSTFRAPGRPPGTQPTYVCSSLPPRFETRPCPSGVKKHDGDAVSAIKRSSIPLLSAAPPYTGTSDRRAPPGRSRRPHSYTFRGRWLPIEILLFVRRLRRAADSFQCLQHPLGLTGTHQDLTRLAAFVRPHDAEAFHHVDEPARPRVT